MLEGEVIRPAGIDSSDEELSSEEEDNNAVTSEGAFYDPMLDANGKRIGERCQNPVFNCVAVLCWR